MFSPDQHDPHFKRSESMSWSSNCGCLGSNRERSVVASSPHPSQEWAIAIIMAPNFTWNIYVLSYIPYIQCVYVYICIYICIYMYGTPHIQQGDEMCKGIANLRLLIILLSLDRMLNSCQMVWSCVMWPTGWCPQL